MAVKGLWGSIDEFLKQCEQSSDSAYSALRSLLERLEDPKTRVQARIFLSDLQKRFDAKEASEEQCLQTYHFLIQDIYLEQNEGYQRRKKLSMLVIPSIFIPEDWSFTFYEGLNRHPDSIFKEKTVAELGCGNGWISIALAEKWLPLKVYGLDINPRAIKISWINLYLNALDENGQPIYDGEGKTLLERVEFQESDLLGYCRDHKIELERIVGCIPQILNPNPDAMSKMITENASEEFLHSLSNYCALQNTKADKLPEDVLTVIEAPRQSDLMIELIKKLKPQVVVTGMAQFEAITSSAFQHLLETTREIGARIFLDISDHFELSSLPSSNGVLKYLAGNYLPPHASIICGLLKNQVYSDLEVAFVISEEESIFKALSKTVELLEGNTALISQYYYGCLFHDLLAFQLADRHPPAEREGDKVKAGGMIGFASSAISVLDHAELSITETDNSSLIHMDVDQSFLPIPSPVKAAIFESFARQNVAESETDVTTSIRQFIKSNYGYPTDSNTEFIYADRALPLFNKLVLCCIQEGGTLCFPAGSNGNYVSAARFLKANVMTIPTHSEAGFKLTEKILTSVFDTVNKPWVYISGPTINPTGLIYSNGEIENILSTCAKFGARVVIDTSFSGLEFDSKDCGSWELEHSLAKLNSSGKPTFCVSLLGGLSLNMLTGGLTFGFLVLNQPFLIDTFHSFSGLSKPHSTLKYTLKKLLDLRVQRAENLLDAIAEQKKHLGSRSKRLKETLENCGWKVIEALAGVSMVATPSAYLGKTLSLKGDATSFQAKLEDSNIREAIVKATGLCINSALWTGIPGYCRFTTALEDSEFERALDCIIKFKKLIN